MDGWAYQFGVQLDFIRPGKPVENSYIESFNGRLRDECLNVEVFFALADVRDKLERRRQDTTRYVHTARCVTTRRRCSRCNGQRPRRPVRTSSGLGGKARSGRNSGDTQLSLLSAKNAVGGAHTRRVRLQYQTLQRFARKADKTGRSHR